MKNKVCSFTGHRPQNLPFGYNEHDPRCEGLKRALRDEIVRQIQSGATHFISGMALGVDMYAAEIVLDLKREYPYITLEAAIPCETQAIKWRESDRDRYYTIIEHCDKETLVQKQYSADCMQHRNRYMVDHSDVVIAVWNGQPDGTGKTIAYAIENGKTVDIIDPSSYAVKETA